MLEKSKIINVTLEGSEYKVSGLSGFYAEITNLTGHVVYASTKPGIAPANKDVVTVLAGRKEIIALPFNSKDLYLLGEGTISILGTDYPANNYVPSNPNLLINPDFRINQRGKSEYSGGGYTVDGWSLSNPKHGSYSTNGNIVKCAEGSTYCTFKQSIEESEKLSGRTITVSVKSKHACGIWNVKLWLRTDEGTDVLIGSSTQDDGIIKTFTAKVPELSQNETLRIVIGVMEASEIALSYAKIELGSLATPFTPPAPAIELMKCQRYYQIRTRGDIDPIDLSPSMRITPTITLLDNGTYEYSAEL